MDSIIVSKASIIIVFLIGLHFIRMDNNKKIVFDMNVATDEKNKTILERTAMTCPVFLSLNPEIDKRISFNWKQE